MKLTCPKCQSKSSVPDERVPKGGAWARCPKCGERFYILPPGKSGGLDLQPQKTPVKSARGRSEEAQKMIDRLRSKTEIEAATTLDGPAYSPDIITVFPQPVQAHFSIYAVIGVMIALVGFVLVGSFNKGGQVKVASAKPTEVISTNAYGETELRADFLLLRKLTTQRPHLRHRVNYSGYETRVFKHFLNEMAPHECQEITALYIQADRADNGFTVTATCLDPGRIIPEMKVKWEGRDAVIMWDDRGDRRRFTLFPPEKKTGSGGRDAERETAVLEARAD